MDNPAQPVYIPYLKAMPQLIKRLNATPEELAMWIVDMKLKAYCFKVLIDNAEIYERTNFPQGEGGFNYQKYLQDMYFLAEDIQQFKPNERYITGETLIARWGKNPVITDVRHFIGSKICESRLDDRHPTHGGTAATREAFSTGTLPPLEQGLFSLSDVEAIEAEDFDNPVPKPKGHLDHDLELQKRANEIAAELSKAKNRTITKGEVANKLAKERGLDVATIKRRIRKEW